ncbi:MAG: hypothetical protein ABI969_08015 [bacterium]
MGNDSTKKVAASAATESPAQQLAAFIAKFDPDVANVIRNCRSALRKIMPTANELVYDNYNFFVIGYCPSERPTDCIVSLAAAANDRLTPPSHFPFVLIT